jgi:RecA-family ATPase
MRNGDFKTSYVRHSSRLNAASETPRPKRPDINDQFRQHGPERFRQHWDSNQVDAAEAFGLQSDIKAKSPSPKGWRDHVFTAAALQHMTFPPISYVIPGVLPEGLSIFAGRPKIGKSWLAGDVCIAVAAGRICLGDRKPIQGNVLYAALEDNPRRLQRRFGKLVRTFSETWPEQLTLATSWRRLDKGGVNDIRQWIEDAPEPRLIVLDTLAGVRPIKTTNGYTEDYETLAALHRLANEKGVAILVLHHTRKMEADDPLDTVSGTLGLAGCADTVLVLNRSSQGTTLYVRGRDIEEAEHAVSFDRNTCRWTILGNASDVQRSDQRGRILEALLEAGDPLSPDEIARAAGMKRNNVDRLLGKMVADGEILKIGRGRYCHPDHKKSDPR